MTDAEIQQLRSMLEEIDARLLSALADGGGLDDDKLRKISLYEAARVSVLRVLASADRPAAR